MAIAHRFRRAFDLDLDRAAKAEPLVSHHDPPAIDFLANAPRAATLVYAIIPQKDTERRRLTRSAPLHLRVERTTYSKRPGSERDTWDGPWTQIRNLRRCRILDEARRWADRVRLMPALL